MWKNQLAAYSLLLFACASASGQVGAATETSARPAEPQVVNSDEGAKRLQAFVTLLSAACTPQLVEQAWKDDKACALIWYALDEDQSATELPRALARTGYRPIVDVKFSEDGDPFKTLIKVAHPQTGSVYVASVTQLATAMKVEYVVRTSETLTFRYRVIGVIFPSLCKGYPDKCGMKTYRPRAFELREYRNTTFDRFVPGIAAGSPLPVPK